MRENKVTLAQAIGFAITLLIVFGTSWVSLHNRISVVETRVEVNQNVNKEISKDMKEMQKTLVEIQVMQAEILQRLKNNE